MADLANHKKRPAATRERTRSVRGRPSVAAISLNLAGPFYGACVDQLLRAGWRPLHALVGAHVVSFGAELGDEGLAAVIERVARRHYKPRSIARARRELTASGVLA